jgi:hypothetical protein
MTRRIMLVLSAVATVMVMQALVGAPPARALGKTPDDTWMTNGRVYATALSEDGRTLYIGGNFTRVRENPRGLPGGSLAVRDLAAIDVATGTPLRAWKPKVTGDGAVVHSLAVKGGRVFIGGNFTAVEEEPRTNLAAVDATNGSVDPFAPQVGGANSYVYALLASNSKLYIGGAFKGVEGQSHQALAAFDFAFATATGALEIDHEWRPTASSRVRDLEFASDRASIFVAGAFTSITGSDGTEDARQSVARVYADTGNLHPWKIPSGTIEGPQTGWDLTATPKMLYGGFGDGPNYLAAFKLDADDNLGTQAWRFRTVGNVQTVALSADGSRLFFGGHFGTNNLEQQVCGDKYLSGLASVRPATGSIYCDWIPQLEPSIDNTNGAWALTATGAHLWVGGGFTHVSGVDQANLARFTL